LKKNPTTKNWAGGVDQGEGPESQHQRKKKDCLLSWMQVAHACNQGRDLEDDGSKPVKGK
jgi:hypothetical protein